MSTGKRPFLMQLTKAALQESFLQQLPSVVGWESVIARTQGGCDLGINQLPWTGKMAALPLNCQSSLNQRMEQPEGHQEIRL